MKAPGQDVEAADAKRRTASRATAAGAGVNPGVSVFVCRQCIPEGGRLPRQWAQDGVHVQVQELPCSGKTDAQYLFHAIEAGARGVLVVTCLVGECRLSEGNYRAETRIRMVRRLLSEIGMEQERAALVRCTPGENLEAAIRDAVNRFCALGSSPILGDAPCGLRNERLRQCGCEVESHEGK